MAYADDNWAKLVEEYDPLIGDKYLDEKGNEYIFIGLLHGQDDFYFVMWREGTVRLLTCVGIPEQMGFVPSNARVQERRRVSADVAWNPLLGRGLWFGVNVWNVCGIYSATQQEQRPEAQEPST